MESWIAVILAAGKGTRMRSKRPKVLHEICGRPMVSYVVDAAQNAGVSSLVVVVRPGQDSIQSHLGTRHSYAQQKEQLGSGHALLQARPRGGSNTTHSLVLNGDLPLIRPKTLQRMMRSHMNSGAVMTFLTAPSNSIDSPGRIIRNTDGTVTNIVEENQATEEQLSSDEANAGAYCFDSSWLWDNLEALSPGSHGEVYLTGLAQLAYEEGAVVETVPVEEKHEALGVDTRVRLAEAESIMRQRIRKYWMLNGVTLSDPSSAYIDIDVEIAPDTVIGPQTTLSGQTKIGQDCVIGPNSVIRDSIIGQRCRILSSTVESSWIEDNVEIGPYSHMRPETHIGKGTHIGNFVEVKKSRLGQATAVGHFSYIGDATIGENVNVGAGTITCNFDGDQKHPTIIEDNVFVGCDSMLVAPLVLGARSKTGAGAVVTKNVPPDMTVAGVPARPIPQKSSGKTSRSRADGRPPSTSQKTRKR